jgi:single-strand DNA-binding protein
MSLASNRFYKQDTGFEKEVSFFDVETWSRLAESCYAKGKKGRGVRVVGRLKQDRWTGADGKPHSRITIIAEHVEFRPEFKKEEKPVMESAIVNQDANSYDYYPDEENDEAVMGIPEKEMEPVVF